MDFLRNRGGPGGVASFGPRGVKHGPRVVMSQTVKVLLNGGEAEVESDARRSLLNVLRDELDLTGCHYGCGEGQCGSCTVLIDGRAVRACRVMLEDASGKRVTTIEGLGRGGALHPVQQAFLEEEAFQCGYCTSGMILSAVALLEADPDPDDAAIDRAMEGNICRCGVYNNIRAAIRRAVQLAKEEGQ